jgi:LuxR family maltose regulon positive regulatory protein
MALLLKTKLFVPPVRAERVSRPRLLARLNTIYGPDNRFTRTSTLISAPAGYGKTTLLTEWIAQIVNRKSEICNPKFCWLSLDVGDNDPARFWAYVIAALQTGDPGIGQSASTLLQSTSSPGLPAHTQTETPLTALINDIAESPDRFIVVFDDYHLIETPTIHQGVTFFLDHCPPQVHIVIATRADPPLPLSRLRAQNLLLELRAADLIDKQLKSGIM